MERKGQRAVKSWSTREQIADDLERLARKFENKWGYTLDRSKLLNCFCGALFKAETYLDQAPGPIVNEQSLEEAITTAICQSVISRASGMPVQGDLLLPLELTLPDTSRSSEEAAAR